MMNLMIVLNFLKNKRKLILKQSLKKLKKHLMNMVLIVMNMKIRMKMV